MFFWDFDLVPSASRARARTGMKRRKAGQSLAVHGLSQARTAGLTLDSSIFWQCSVVWQAGSSRERTKLRRTRVGEKQRVARFLRARLAPYRGTVDRHGTAATASTSLRSTTILSSRQPHAVDPPSISQQIAAAESNRAPPAWPVGPQFLPLLRHPAA